MHQDSADPLPSPWPTGALGAWLAARRAEAAHVAEPRRAALAGLAAVVVAELEAHGRVDVVFICTHNSRRSHFGQVWAAVAAAACGVSGVRTWSGGTEATAFEPRAVAALGRAGLLVSAEGEGPNPTWLVRTSVDGMPQRCWSKHFADAANPQKGFVAVMTCTSAAEACPIVPGAAHRIALPYDDPKAFDDTAGETAAYDDRCAQIAREMLVVFAQVAHERAARP